MRYPDQARRYAEAGEALRAERMARGVTRKELSALIGYSAGTVRNAELGGSSSTTIVEAFIALGVPPHKVTDVDVHLNGELVGRRNVQIAHENLRQVERNHD